MTGRRKARAVLANAIVAMQPAPEETSVTHFDAGGRPATAIARLWRPEDVRRCRLCERCQLADHPRSRMCSVVVYGHVSEERAAMFSESDVPTPTPEARPAWRPIGPLDHPWWRRDADEASPPPAADRRDAQSLAWEAFVRGTPFERTYLKAWEAFVRGTPFERTYLKA